MNATTRAKACAATAAICVTTLLTACGGSSSSAPVPPSGNSGTLVFAPAAPLSIKQGSSQEVLLSLESTDSTVGKRVRIATSDAAIADVSPAACTLSGVSQASKQCMLRVIGKALGTVSLLAQAEGMAEVRLTGSVGTNINYGTLAVASASGSYVTASPVGAAFAASGTGPYTLPLKAKLLGSSGVDTGAGAVIEFSSSTAGVTFNPAQCAVTTLAPECSTMATLPTAAAATITVGASASQYTAYSGITVNAAPAASSANGTISLSTQPGNNVPNGMKAPLFVNWSNPTTADTVTLTLNLQGGGISFYSYAPGDNTTLNTSQTQICTLKFTGTGQAGNALSCGFGLVGQATTGNVTVSATAASTAQQTYSIAPLGLGAVAPEPTRRAVTFSNSSSQMIYVGITGGAAAAWINATTPAVPPGQTTANLKPGAGSTCGPSNPLAACPMGTTCMQGGASPSSKVADTPFYCYYDQTSPNNGYALAANAGATTTLSISGSSLAPNGVIWSGNFYARTGCDPASGQCENATCKGSAGGLVCGPGTGPSPGTNTLAEVTFQAYPGPDFYDVSIINGANFATEFGPSNVAASTTNAYTCGVAGSRTAQGGGFPGNAAGLPAAPWTMTASSASFPPGVTIAGDAASYYRLVAVQAGPLAPKTCTDNTPCTDGTNTTCGYAMADVVTGGSFTYAARTCGKPVGWLTVDAIWGFNPTAANVAPFAFGTTWSNGNGGTVSVGDLQLCINQTYSAYQPNGTASSLPAFPIQPMALACGGVMWGTTEIPGPQLNPTGNVGLAITRPTQPVQTANANWIDYVLPTIKWLKQACPTCYTFPFDDMSSTFTCSDASRNPSTSYSVTFSDLN
jgi:hypothetical protein